MRYVLAVDGGNSKTLAAVADETGRALSAGLSGGCNYQGCGKEAAAREIGEAIGRALSGAGLSRVEFACYGIAGADRDKDFETIRRLIAPLDPAQESVLVNDTLLALRAATPDGVGVALIGGAGSNCIGMNEEGRIEKAGGLGPLTGDKANAGALVQDAVIAALKGVDGRGPRTLLEGKLKEALGLSALEDVIEFGFADSGRAVDLGSLAPLVFAAAEEGDRVALELLEDHGRSAGEAALAVLRKLFSSEREVVVALGGSVLQKGGHPALVNTARETVVREFPKVSWIVLSEPPLTGGILRALDGLGVKTDAALLSRVKRSLDDRLAALDGGIK